MATVPAILSDVGQFALSVSQFVSGVDVVGVFDASFNQVFENARPMKAEVRENARSMEHPIETGQIITDYRILLPVEINLPMIMTADFYEDTYNEISDLYENAELLSVQTRTGLYQNMVITEMPHEETAEMFDAVTIYLRFREVFLVEPQSISSSPTPANYAPADPTKTNTQPLGQQNPSVTYTPTSGGFVTPSGVLVSGVAGQSTPNLGPDLTVPQNQYNLSGVATMPVQTGFR